MSRVLKSVLGILALVIVGIQFVPVERTNPPVEAALEAPPEVMAMLRESCYDCHSNETEWPWYSRVAPVSWLVAKDVNEGREHLNLSDWGRLEGGDRRHAAEEMWEEVDEGKMPLGIYLAMHRDAEPTEEDLAVLRTWVASVTGGIPSGAAGEADDGHEGHDH